MSGKGPQRLGNLLVERGFCSLEQLQSALEFQKKQGGGKLLGEILVELQYCTEDHITECLACIYGVPYAKLEPRIADPRIVDVLPREYIEKNLVFPLYNIRGTLPVALTEPANLFLIDEIRGLTHLEIQIVSTTAKDV